MADNALSTTDNLFDFFRQQVDSANASTGTGVSDEGVYYLANLLTERGHMPAANRPDTLVELHLQAATGDRSQALQRWRELGDQALYTVGFFRGSIERKRLDPEYYVEMGASAYHRLSRMLEGPRGAQVGGGRGMDDIFGELAACFEACGEVLREVKQQVRAETSDTSDAAVLALYEEWLTTGSRHAAARLRALGVVPMGPGGREPAC
jgi:hypothetical protein